MQRGSGNSYLPTGNYASGASLRRSNITLISVTPLHGAHSQYVQGSEQRTSQSTNLSLPTIVNPTLENSADGPLAAWTNTGTRFVGSMLDHNAPYTSVIGGLGQDMGSTSVGNSTLQNQRCYCGRMREVPEEASENVLPGENSLRSHQVEYCTCHERSTRGSSFGSFDLSEFARLPPNATITYEVASHPGPIHIIAALSHGSIYLSRVEPQLNFVPGSTSFSNWNSMTSLANGSTIYRLAITPRNYLSYWIPAAILVNSLAPVSPIMHAPSSFVPLPHSPWHWTYNSIQVPSMYPMNGTIGSEVILLQDSLPLVPTYQFPQISLVGGAERVITGENMVNFNFPVQQLNFPVIHTPRFTGDYFWHPPFLRGGNHAPGPIPLHPYNFYMALNGGGQNGIPRTFYIDVDNMSYEGLVAFQNRVGFVSTGLSKEVICARLKCTKYQPVEKSEDDNDMCIICLEDFCDGQIIGYSDCGHKFHSNCITEWLMQKNSCPFCRRTVLTI